MQVSKDKVAIINYTLKDDEGNVVDQSENGEFAYLHGASNIIPGLENALEGKTAGDALVVTIAPAEAYGERDESRIQAVPRAMFPPDVEVEVGMQFHAQSPEGQTLMVTVAAVETDTITVDGNHPMAGKTLHFDVAIVEVRDATQEELDHGHVHHGDHHHH